MIIGDLLKVYKGEIRVFNKYDDKDVGIIDTSYKGWVKVSYWNCEIVEIQLEMLNTAVLSARIVAFIDDAQAGGDPGDVEEATKQDIEDLVDNIYKDEDENNKSEDEETIRIVTQDYYDHFPLPGDEDDFGDKDAEEATDEEVQEVVDEAYSDPEDEEATEEDINSLMGSIYDD